MSFEGYYQFLCKKGHYWTENVYSIDADPLRLIPPSKQGVGSVLI